MAAETDNDARMIQLLEEIAERTWVSGFEQRYFFSSSLGSVEERLIDIASRPEVFAIHLGRYRFARDFAKGRRVLDMACGTGYGSNFLATAGGAESVLGVDLDFEAVRYATHRYRRPNLKYAQGDACKPFTSDKFGTIVSFETIEHVPDPDAMLGNVAGMLEDDGVYLVSTPIRQTGRLEDPPANPHHFREWNSEEFAALLGRYFGKIEWFGQNWPLDNRGAAVPLPAKLMPWVARLAGASAAEIHALSHQVKPLTPPDRWWIARKPKFMVAVCRSPRR